MGIGKQIALALAVAGWAQMAQAHCAPDHVHVQTDRGKTIFSVDLAQTPEDRERGLMFVQTMPRFSGMLFVFDDMGQRVFWMKNTLIPLDIIFIDASGSVLNVAADAVPGDLTGLPSDGPAQFVLEINGGMSAALGIGVGSQIRHPAIGNANDHATCVN